MCNQSSCRCGGAHYGCNTEFQYAVKIVCGEVFPSQGEVPTPVAPGRYWTAINIHNPEKCREARFRWKVAVANPGKPGPVMAYSRPLSLRPDEALEIDCQQVMQAFPPPPPKFVKGFVVIESDVELDVVAVYTATPGGCGSPSFHTERVQPRCVPVCEDLVLPLHTGLADWRTISPTVGPVAPVSSQFWGPAPVGSIWVSQTSSDGHLATPGLRQYEFCFDLCFGYTVPGAFPIQVSADNSATVTLNSAVVGTVSGSATPTTLTVNPGLLRAGNNCLRVQVTNIAHLPPQPNNPTAFALAGMLRVIRGKCPCSPLPLATRSPGIDGLAAEGGEPSPGA